MRRGTRVGQAYVAITADGSGINEDIVDAVDEAGPGVERAGREHGEGYGDEFSEGFLDRMRGRFADKIAARFRDTGRRGGEQAGKDFSTSFGDNLDDNLLDHVGERIGARVGGHLVDALNHAMTSDGFDDNALRSVYKSLTTQSERAGTDSGEAFAERFAAVIEKRLAEVNIGAVVSGNRGRDRSLGDRIGAIFGAGSRNNALNVLGKSIGGMINLADKARSGVSALVKTFVDGFTAMGDKASLTTKLFGGFANTMGTAGSGIGSFFSTILSSGPAIAVVIGVIVVAMSALASVISALIALVTALAAAITGALTGALAVLGGGILAVVAAAGLLTAAFMSMTDAQKSLLKDAFTPLRQEMVGIGQLMIQQMVPAFSTWSTNLQNALLLVAPLAKQMGAAFAEAGNTITASLSGPGFQRLATSLGEFLPSIITRLSRAFGGFLNGTAALFAAVMPLVNQFAGYLTRIADRFATWASSAQGQNSIEQFMKRAAASIQSVWNFLTQFIGYIGDVLFNPTSMAAGNSIFDSLARSFRGFREDFARAAADGSLKKWFDDAIAFGKDLGNAIAALTRTFKDLYNSGTLQSVGDIINQIAGFIEKTVKALGPLLDVLGFILPKTLKIAFAPLNILLDLVLKIGEGFVWAANKIRDFLEWTGLVAKSKGVDPGPNIPGSDQPGVGTGLKGLLGGGGKTPGAGSGNPLADITGQKNFQLPKTPTADNLKLAGATALAGTNLDKAVKNAAKKFKNPYLAFANEILKDAPGVAASVKNALLDINEQVVKAINEASSATGGDSVTSALSNLADSITSSAEQTVNSAQQALYSAANSLASASSMKAANKALKEVKRAQKSVAKAQADQARIQAVADLLAAQAVQTESNVLALVSGNLRVNATLADIAEARARVADLITDANQKLAEAIQIRDQYSQQVADSIRTFGSLLSAQAKTINGVQQALTATDIITSLEDRLAKIKKFQENLRLLLAQGISQDVYRQLVEAGVDGGSAYADALVAGGPGAIDTVNQLVGDISKTADAVGGQASTRLYQAGVDGAQALLDGLTSIDAQLIAAGETLGSQIAAAIQRGLGTLPTATTPPPSSSTGGGGSGGISVGQGLGPGYTPPPTAPSGGGSGGISIGQGLGRVSAKSLSVTVITPTEDPRAVAVETVNEIVGRL